ncbi:hypothetical protein AAHE18_04G071200 [Arachis hypogaea]
MKAENPPLHISQQHCKRHAQNHPPPQKKETRQFSSFEKTKHQKCIQNHLQENSFKNFKRGTNCFNKPNQNNSQDPTNERRSKIESAYHFNKTSVVIINQQFKFSNPFTTIHPK